MAFEKIKRMYNLGEYAVHTGVFAYYYGKLNHLPQGILEQKKYEIKKAIKHGNRARDLSMLLGVDLPEAFLPELRKMNNIYDTLNL